MWGSVSPNDNNDCSWDNCPWGQEEPPIKTLDAAHDAAQVAGLGRIPTNEDFKELLANTTNEWIENYQGSGVNGRLFTSKINCHSIFIPSSGFHSNSFFYCQDISALVWSSSLCADRHTKAYGFYFDSSVCLVGNDDRYVGFPIRPVLD